MNNDNTKSDSRRNFKVLIINEQLHQAQKTETAISTHGDITHDCNNIPEAITDYTNPAEAMR